MSVSNDFNRKKCMKKALKTFITTAGLIGCLSLLVFNSETVTNYLTTLNTRVFHVEPAIQENNWQVLEVADSSGFINGPVVAHVGELCVFRLNNPGVRADWAVVPPAKCYVDSSGSSLAFASNVPAKYTIVAAIVEDGVPKILQHVCEYGISPEPTPSPSPTPSPTPTPKPTPPTVLLGEWIRQNVPEAGRGQCAALAACYEATADAIEKGAIRTTDAAYSTLRTATQTKIKPEKWSSFLDQLAMKVTEKLGDGDVKKLGTILTEIADGLKAVSELSDVPEDKVPGSSDTKIPETKSPICSDPTGQACQLAPKPTSTSTPTPTTTLFQYRRSR